MRRRASVTCAAASTWRTPGPAASTSSVLGRRRGGRRPRPGGGRTAPAAPGWRRPPTASTPVVARRAGRAGRCVSVTGISSGVVTIDEPGARRVLEDVDHPRRLVAHHADLHQLADHPRRADLGDDVAARLGVDDDEVVVALAHLVGELADGEDLLDARRGVGDEVERAGQRADAADERDLDEQPQVLAQRVLGVHRHREQVGGRRSRGSNASGVVSNAAASAPLASISHTSVRLPGAGAEVGERGGDRGLADAALAGDEQQLAVEQVAAGAVMARGQPPKPMRRSPSVVPIST